MNTRRERTAPAGPRNGLPNDAGNTAGSESPASPCAAGTGLRCVEDFASQGAKRSRRIRADENYDEAWKERTKARCVVDANGCWLWQGFIRENGYGSTSHRGHKGSAAHRLVYLVWKGPIPAGHDVCHSCDVRNCLNPEHLWAGTRKENLHDMLAKGRHMHQVVTHCKRGHDYAVHGHSYGTKNRHWRRCKLCDQIVSRSEKVRVWRRAYQRTRRAAKRAARLEQRI